MQIVTEIITLEDKSYDVRDEGVTGITEDGDFFTVHYKDGTHQINRALLGEIVKKEKDITE